MKKNYYSRNPRYWLQKGFRIMRITIFLCLISVIQVVAIPSLGQVKLDLKMKNTTIEELLQKMEENTSFRFFYQSEDLQNKQHINIDFSQKSVREILDEVLPLLQLRYEVFDNYIAIKTDDGGFRNKLSDQEQKSVSGKVTDSSGSPMPGVTVVVKGTMNGTVTNSYGNYSLSNVPPEATLRFSFVGMETQEVTVANQSTINIQMEVDAIGIEEVVAIGYGTMKKSDLTGTVASVKIEDSPLSLFSPQNALETLRGEVTGLNISQVTSAGGNPTLEVRGQNSIYGSNTPLIVLDGIIYSGSLSDINPNDIATYDILKDAVSTAIYGARSANGVIVITTKKGKTEKPVFSFNASTEFKSWQNKPQLMNGTQYLEIFNEKYRQPHNSVVNLTGSELENYENGIETDWLDLIVRTGIVQNYQLAVSGSAKRINYYLSSSYNDTKNVIIGDDFNRISVLSKLDMDVTDWLNIGMNVNLSRRDYSGFAAGLGNALTLSPWTDPYRDDQGNLEKYPRENSYVNPLWGVNDDTRDNSNINHLAMLNAHAEVKVPWVKGLSYTINYRTSFERRDIENFYHESYYVNEGSEPERYSSERIQSLLIKANGNIQNSKTNAFVLDNIVSYKRKFDKHNIYATLVATRDKESFYQTTIEGSDFSDNGNTSLGAWGYYLAKILTSDANSYISTNIGYLGRLNYSYNNKYYISGSVRRDGASVFGENTKWGVFSAVGLAWRISNEDFFYESSFVNSLKLKLSWGQNGNQGIGPYTTLSTVKNGFAGGSIYEFPDAPESFNYGLYQDRLGNPNLGWETTESVNTGFESVLFNNRAFLDLDFYFSKTTDQLFDRVIPIMSGFNSMKASMGQVDNNGIEITARTVNIKNNNGLNWETSVIAWKNSNKLVHIYGEDLDNDGKEDDDITNNLFIGHSLGAIYGYVQDGIVQEDDTAYIALTGSSPGDPKYKDIDGVDGISTSDRKILGYSKPKFKISVGNTLSYKNLSFYALFSGTFGGKNYYLKNNKRAFSSATPSRSSENGIYLPYWTPKNKSNTYPAVTYNPDSRYRGLQSRSYLKLQRVSVSYMFRKQVLDLVGINSLKIFLTAQELFAITKWKGGDPEAGIGVASSAYPVTTNYSIGINLNF